MKKICIIICFVLAFLFSDLQAKPSAQSKTILLSVNKVEKISYDGGYSWSHYNRNILLKENGNEYFSSNAGKTWIRTNTNEKNVKQASYNAFSQRINLNNNLEYLKELKIIDVYGNIICDNTDMKLEEGTFVKEKLNKGVYIIIINTENQTDTYKLLVD